MVSFRFFAIERTARDDAGTTALKAFLNNADMIDLSSCAVFYCIKVRP